MRPLPAVLLDLHEDLATGKLVLRRGRVSKSVDLVNGNPVSTASTPRDETLGHFLVNSGVITEDEHRKAVAHAATIGGKLGEALVALSTLTVEQLIEQLGKQARHKLVQALRWPQGAWRFDSADDALEGMQLRMVEVVLSGLRETAVEDLSRLARLDGLSFELTDRGKRLRHELRRTWGERAVAQLAMGTAIGELEKTFGDRAQARIAVDSMLMCDAITTQHVAIGLGSGPPRPATTQAVGSLSLPRTRTRPSNPEELYDVLFDDIGLSEETVLGDGGASPLDFSAPDAEIDDNDSGVVSPEDIKIATKVREQAAAIRQVIVAEAQRIQGADHYAVLLIERETDAEDVDAAYQVKLTLLDRNTSKVTEPRDLAKLDEIRHAYADAHSVLTDARKRAAYDRELAGGELVQVPPSIDTELNFRGAEELMAKQQWAQAISIIKTVIARAPTEADYHAALGWSEWNAGHEQPAAADTARPHLNHALSINPDHARAHDYKGRIESALRTDDANALFHLERAIDLDPERTEAIATIESLLVARGELRRLERVLKRMLFRLRGRGGPIEASAWARLARLYLDHLDDPASAAAALGNARKLAPKEAEVVSLSSRLEHRRNALEPIRAGWREALNDPQSGAALVRTTEAAGHGDAAFLAASTMVALATADDAMQELYEQHRVRTVTIPTTPLNRDQWAMLRHRDDTVELGALLELLAPAVHVLAPMTLPDAEIDPSQRIADTDLPPTFAKLRRKLCDLIGVPPAPVYARVELGIQIHVVACEPPILVAGDEALTALERPDLVFNLARALTFLWPGRAAGASRPGRVLRAVVLAIVREASGTELGADDPLAVQAAHAVAQLSDETRAQARASALRLLSVSGAAGLNLSVWARSLPRTADRTAMLLCGDVPAAFAGAKEVGDLDKDLVEFAYSEAHVSLRSQLGLFRG
ncbi:MAG: response regulator receiver protein [Myxococcales bacterium]|nr:response regulator receiver protein [Myxococcales bacterium]